jgi:hypothetical protein
MPKATMSLVFPVFEPLFLYSNSVAVNSFPVFELLFLYLNSFPVFELIDPLLNWFVMPLFYIENLVPNDSTTSMRTAEWV